MRSNDALNDDNYRETGTEPLLLEDYSDALIVCDDGGAVGYMNTQAERLFGVDARLAKGRPVTSVVRLRMPDGAALESGYVQELSGRQGATECFDECMLLRREGNEVPVACEMASIDPGAVLLVIRSLAAGDLRSSLAYRASHDSLTGLPNRQYLQDRLVNLHRSAEAQRAVYSLLLLDLDHFKIVNDRFGHATGDQVLAQVGRRIAHKVREMDTVGRWGGEEFLCLLPGVEREPAEEVAERIRAGLEAQPVEHQGRQIRVTSSIGIATYPDDGLDHDSLLAKADAALYEAKRLGRNRIQSVTRHASNVFALAHVIEQSLVDERIQPAYQPIVDLVSGQSCGEEALARIQLDDRQVMEAAAFMPAAEQLNLVHLIDHRIVRSAVAHCVARSPREGASNVLFLNFSADFLRHREFVEDVLNLIKQQWPRSAESDRQIKPLVIEITERQFLDNKEEARERLQPFLDMGVRLAIDDFGAGFSSLGYLADLPVSFIKLEGSFVRRIRAEPRVRLIIQGICDLAVELGVITVAEGIETRDTALAVQDAGVEWGQGHYFARPAFQRTPFSNQKDESS